jgi:hypothetical protein
MRSTSFSPRKTRYRIALWIAVACAVLVAVSLALLLVARAAVRPAPGDWATTVRLGPVPVELGVAALIQWGTTPWIAQQLHGRSLPTRVGTVHMAWDATAQRMVLRCRPCEVRSASWGSEPLRLNEATFTVRRRGMALDGTLTTGAVAATWTGELRPSGLVLHIDVPTTSVRDGYALFANAVPELATAQIDGRFALRATLELPSQALIWSPQLEGFVVSGLGTEDWSQAQSQCNQSLPARYRDAAVGPSSLLARAVLAAEDQRFYQHPGYDLREMTEALHHNQQEDATLRGASTLSQQVAKLLVTGGERSPVRKLRELLYAVEMEQTLGKARILRLYLNQAPWGATVCGAQAAAYAYFGKSAKALSGAEAVWLAAMLHNPALEARRWQAKGTVNLGRAQWVADNLRPLSKRERSAIALKMPQLVWLPPQGGAPQ